MARLLIVGESEKEEKFFRRTLQSRRDWQLTFAKIPSVAVEVLEVAPIDLVITSGNLPGQNGLSLLKQIREIQPRIPVVVISSSLEEELVMEVLQTGAAAYLPKRWIRNCLATTIEEALNVARLKQGRLKLLDSLEFSHSRFAIKTDPNFLPVVIDRLQSSLETYGICEGPQVLQIGIALQEALANAVYHGNLGVESRLKELPGKAFDVQVQQRMLEPPYCQRKVYVEEVMSREEARFIIRDEGEGFLQENLPDPTQLEWLTKPHGRGVMMMKSFMDEVIYNERGNEVTLIKRNALHGDSELSEPANASNLEAFAELEELCVTEEVTTGPAIETSPVIPE